MIAAGGTCTVMMYHYVREAAEPFPGLKALSPGAFEAQLDWLTAHYEIIGLKELEAAILEGRNLGGDTALLTFDDGFVDHHRTVAPILRARGLSATFFLAGATMAARPWLLNVHKTHFLIERLGADGFASAVRERVAQAHPDEAARWDGIYRIDESADRAAKRLLNYELPFEEADRVLDELFATHVGAPDEFAAALYLSRAMVDEMGIAGMSFGFHTHTHRVLSRLDADGQARELAGGVERIRRWTGQARVPFCYPYGRPLTYDAGTVAELERAGYSIGFTTVRRVADPDTVARFEVPRFDTNDLPPRGAVTVGDAGRLVPVVTP
jgi:peptidoglycan/xylan/chitin deacetylase (PgdA/CDA1 family)